MYSVGGGSNFQNLKAFENSGEGCVSSIFDCLVNFKCSDLCENWNEIKVFSGRKIITSIN